MFRIKHEGENYFHGMSNVGPKFGATKEEATVFEDKIEAVKMLSSHFGFGMASIEESKS